MVWIKNKGLFSYGQGLFACEIRVLYGQYHYGGGGEFIPREIHAVGKAAVRYAFTEDKGAEAVYGKAFFLICL